MAKGEESAPAAPVTAGNQVYATGLTKREWFAGMAMQGLIAGGKHEAEKIPRLAYAYADAKTSDFEASLLRSGWRVDFIQLGVAPKFAVGLVRD